MAVKKNGLGKGLGKGLDVLIPDHHFNSNENAIYDKKQEISPATNNNEVKIKISNIEPNSKQPRKKFDEDSLVELAESIKQFGLIQPIVVKQSKDGYYEIIAGERRWRAAKIAGLKEVPVIVKEYSELEIVEISLIENIQRENLNPIEEAMAYKRLLDEFNLKQDEVADRVSKSRAAVTNSIRLLNLSKKVQQMVVEEMISAGHARALLGIENVEEQNSLAERILDEKLSVRDVEKIVKSLNKKEKIEKNPETADKYLYIDLEEKIKSIMGTKVKINSKSGNKGKIEIEYYSSKDLERIYDLLMSIKENGEI